MLELMNTPTSRKFEMKDKLHKKKQDKEMLELIISSTSRKFEMKD